MKVWILQTGEPIHTDLGNFRPMRAMNLADELAAEGHQVVLISSKFDHITKTDREIEKSRTVVNSNLEIVLIPSRGYKSHVGFARVIDHLQLAFRLRSHIRNLPKPDVAFVGFPPIELAWTFSKFLKKREIPFLLDVKDAWPEIYLKFFPEKLSVLAKFLLFPLYIIRRNTFKNASAICSISGEFLEWALSKSGREYGKFDLVVPLTSANLNESQLSVDAAGKWWDISGVEDTKTLRCYFVGTLNQTFDFDPILSAAELTGLEFIICGDGPQREQLIHQFSKLPNVKFPGWITTIQAQVLAQRSSLSLAPIGDREDFNISIPNKFYDSIKYGKPILTSGKGLPKLFVEDNGVGYFYEDANSLVSILNKLKSDPLLMNELSFRAKKLYLDKFDFHQVYGALVKRLLELSKITKDDKRLV
jgi:glycosyltransferase involved in cell wall biosynthesis